MRAVQTGSLLKLRAIAGLHVVTLGWDFVAQTGVKQKGLLGFAIERTEFAQGAVVENYFLRGIKRFKHKDEGLPAGTPVPTSEHPVQSFQWGDYTAKPATAYRYRVIPVYGTAKHLNLDEGAATAVEVTTEAEKGRAEGGKPAHDIYFNRGVAGSQAYARKFPGQKPDQSKPDSVQMKWLSRGLFEALRDFIGKAAGQDAADYALRAMFYEFQYAPVGKAFAAAHKAGADVQIRYEAQSYKEHNETMIKQAGIKALCKPQKVRSGIRHNKFVVLIHKGKPVAVWTGSTNISAGGIFGHSNVGHIVWDQAIAGAFLDYWQRLADSKVSTGALVAKNMAVQATPQKGAWPDPGEILTLFSPRDDAKTLVTLKWYQALMRSATQMLCMTFAFNLDPLFAKVLQEKSAVLRYAVLDKTVPAKVADLIDKTGNSVIASGAKLDDDDWENFLGEELTGFNKNLYIHDKFLLVDPLGSDPLTVTGTANFSGASQYNNDENMLAIRGDRRVADIYFGEFMRVFDHLYARYLSKKITKKDPDAGFLKEKTADWLSAHLDDNGRKGLRRRYFSGP